ncbi:MAG: hypothetical protein JOZ82_04385, partial [Marmoricola sp.]|nr:hypothetical protein [Marmoricola sp.]
MGRQSQEEVAAAARRRLELLRRELERAGVRRMDEDEDELDEESDPFTADQPSPPHAVIGTGRHARPGQGRPAAWARVPARLHGLATLGGGPVLLVVALVAAAAVVTGVAVVRMGSRGAAVAPTPTGA